MTSYKEMQRFDFDHITKRIRVRVPRDSHIEIEADGVAYLCVEGRRLLYAGNLRRLLDTLERLDGNDAKRAS